MLTNNHECQKNKKSPDDITNVIDGRVSVNEVDKAVGTVSTTSLIIRAEPSTATERHDNDDTIVCENVLTPIAPLSKTDNLLQTTFNKIYSKLISPIAMTEVSSTDIANKNLVGKSVSNSSSDSCISISSLNKSVSVSDLVSDIDCDENEKALNDLKMVVMKSRLDNQNLQRTVGLVIRQVLRINERILSRTTQPYSLLYSIKLDMLRFLLANERYARMKCAKKFFIKLEKVRACIQKFLSYKVLSKFREHLCNGPLTLKETEQKLFAQKQLQLCWHQVCLNLRREISSIYPYRNDIRQLVKRANEELFQDIVSKYVRIKSDEFMKMMDTSNSYTISNSKNELMEISDNNHAKNYATDKICLVRCEVEKTDGLKCSELDNEDGPVEMAENNHTNNVVSESFTGEKEVDSMKQSSINFDKIPRACDIADTNSRMDIDFDQTDCGFIKIVNTFSIAEVGSEFFSEPNVPFPVVDTKLNDNSFELGTKKNDEKKVRNDNQPIINKTYYIHTDYVQTIPIEPSCDNLNCDNVSQLNDENSQGNEGKCVFEQDQLEAGYLEEKSDEKSKLITNAHFCDAATQNDSKNSTWVLPKICVNNVWKKLAKTKEMPCKTTDVIKTIPHCRDMTPLPELENNHNLFLHDVDSFRNELGNKFKTNDKLSKFSSIPQVIASQCCTISNKLNSNDAVFINNKEDVLQSCGIASIECDNNMILTKIPRKVFVNDDSMQACGTSAVEYYNNENFFKAPDNVSVIFSEGTTNGSDNSASLPRAEIINQPFAGLPLSDDRRNNNEDNNCFYNTPKLPSETTPLVTPNLFANGPIHWKKKFMITNFNEDEDVERIEQAEQNCRTTTVPAVAANVAARMENNRNSRLIDGNKKLTSLRLNRASSQQSVLNTENDELEMSEVTKLWNKWNINDHYKQELCKSVCVRLKDYKQELRTQKMVDSITAAAAAVAVARSKAAVEVQRNTTIKNASKEMKRTGGRWKTAKRRKRRAGNRWCRQKIKKLDENICAICLLLYKRSEEWIKCNTCGRWMHRKTCGGVGNEEWNAYISNGSLPFSCPLCQSEANANLVSSTG